MGYLSALDMKEHAGLETAISWHLSCNCYPPLPAVLAGPCKRAIQNARRENWTARIRLPKGMKWRGQSTMTTAEMIEAARLDAFIDE